MKTKIEDHFRGNYHTFFEKYLTSVKKIGGDEFQAICPFHEDSTPSLNFNDQKGTYFCHGCQKRGNAFHFYGKINGLDTRRDFPKILKGIAGDFGIPWEEKKSRIVKTYDYTDEAGNLLFQVCRMEPKDFRQRRPNGNGWTWNLKEVRRVLYRLPDIGNSQEIIIVEGERDSDTLAAMGFVATTCPMGAGKWADEYSQALKGKDVVLMPDSDPQGKKHMAQVGASLNGIAKSLKWIDLPNLPSKGDVSDWVEKIGDKVEAGERLAIMIDGVEFYQPPKQKTLEDAILEVKEFKTVDLPVKRQIIGPWLTEQSISLITGWRGTGKTWFAMSLLDAISRGEPFGPWELKTSVPCLYLEGEMAAQDVRERLDSLNPDQDRQNPLFVYSDAYANSLGLPRANLLSEKWRATMKRVLTTRKVKLWVVDNIASLTGGIDENSKKDWDPINAFLLELRFAGISTVLLHHSNKSGGQRGTSAREDNIDVSITLKRPFDYTAEDGARFIVSFQKARVATKDLSAIGDNQFQLIQDEHGDLSWTWGNVRRETRIEVLKLLDEGLKNQDIVTTLNIDKGYVSRIKNQAIKDGVLSKIGKLTQSGYVKVYGE
ncbi:MAG: AAA family ATPase [Desulfobacteraceae bacterium]|nr:AAA family ATPase [Desulfobacteraceae bacterium]